MLHAVDHAWAEVVLVVGVAVTAAAVTAVVVQREGLRVRGGGRRAAVVVIVVGHCVVNYSWKVVDDDCD